MLEAKGRRRSPGRPAHGAGPAFFAICLLPFAILCVAALGVAEAQVVEPGRNPSTPDSGSAIQAVSTPRGTSRIRGIVVDAETGQPVPRASISIMSLDQSGTVLGGDYD